MNEMKAMTTLVGRGSRITERVRRVNRVLRPRMFWAGRRAEPRSVARHSNSRCRCRIELAPRWARLGNRKGLTNSLPYEMRIAFAKSRPTFGSLAPPEWIAGQFAICCLLFAIAA